MSVSVPNSSPPEAARRIALCDADVLKYMAGFASQKTVWTHLPSGEWFDGKEKANEWFEETYGAPEKNDKGKRVGILAWRKEHWLDTEWESEIAVEEWNNCVAIIEAKVGEILHQCRAADIIMMLTPRRTFRHDLAFTQEYKGNRKDAPKPVYADRIVEYLEENFECITGDNVEADDLLGQFQTVDTVICSNDKDLKMIAGKHYNFSTGEKELVDPFSADRWFMIQLIAGDATDNIAGIPGWGMVKAAKLVDSYDGDHAELVQAIVDLYCDHYGESAREVMYEHAALVWILRAGETPQTAGWRNLLYVEQEEQA